MILVFNGLCDLVMFEVPVESESDGAITSEWEIARMEIANTFTVIASQEAQDLLISEPTEEDKIIHGSANASPMLRLFQQGTKNLKAIAASNVPKTIAELLSEDVVGRLSVDTMISVFEALSAISIYQPITSAVIFLGVGRSLVRIINQQSDFRSYVVSLAIEALWNLIEVGGKDAIQQLAIYPEVVPSLVVPFTLVLMHGYKKDDKCLRNEICVLLNYIVSNPDSHRFFLAAEHNGECILEQMATYAVYDEINGNHTQPLFLVTEEDLELKKLLWTQVFHVCRNPANEDAREIIIQKNFLKCLLMYLDVNQKDNPIITRWRPPQLLELQIHAMTIIGHLTGLLPKHIYEICGH